LRIAANNFLGELLAQRITDQDVVQAFAAHTYFFGEPNLSAKTFKTEDLYKRAQSARRGLIWPGRFLAPFRDPLTPTEGSAISARAATSMAWRVPLSIRCRLSFFGRPRI